MPKATKAQMNIRQTLYQTNAKPRHKEFIQNLPWLIMCGPALILIILFSYIPLPGIVMAFKDFKYNMGIFGSPWVGLDNFKFFFISQDFWTVTRNTVGYNLIFLLAGQFISILFAILMYQITRRYLLKIYQTVMFFPYFLSWVVVGYMLYSLLNTDYGIVNRFLDNFGIGHISWYTEPEYWPFILILVSIWKGVGSGCVIYYAMIIGIDKEFYEAAALDGAKKYQMARYITIPFITPMLILFLLLGIGQIIRSDFGMFYMLPQNIGILKSTTDVIDTYVYNMLKQVGDPGMAAAIGLYQSFVGFILIMVSNALVKKVNRESSLF